MNTKRSSSISALLPTGLTALGAALGLNLLNVMSPVELLDPLSWGQPNPRVALAQQDPQEDINVRVYQIASPSVVSIETRTGSGSGSIISPDGLILTNAHVVSGERTVRVTLADNRTLEGEVIAFAEGGLDLAAVRLRGQTNLPALRLAPPNSVQVGQRAFAIGNPFGRFQNTFTTGIVSRVDPERGIIQTDAAINPGNSGGPLLNSRGEIIGVNSAIFSPRGASGNIGIGFAIAIDRVQNFLVAVREGRAPRVAQQAPMLGGSRPAQQIALNAAPIQGRLAAGSSDLLSDNSYYNAYTFVGRAGQQVTIEMISDEVDPYLLLLSPNGENLAQDDDSAGGKNARLTVQLPADGTYTILANTYGPREQGRYTLRLAAGGTTPQRAGQRVGQQAGQVILQQQGILDDSAPVLESDGSRYREYTFNGQAGQQITISMESPDFDTYLILLDPQNRVVAQNDDIGPNNTNSSLSVRLPATGTYRVLANSYDRTGRGRFTLTVR
ncbi:MAG TPA: trypsin-like peptidase domain-containing protein [Synechococcales cyanobacterium M55_K2018_004]|nr:trypsin-like peptidase domain-containing protein [Synechococcales cyanobacterium M55_K2018_004]